MKDSISEFVKKHRSVIVACMAVIFLYIVLFAVGIGCPIKYLTGVSCPGCGMTRACISALRFDFLQAFEYHPLWFAVLPIAILLVFFRVKRNSSAFALVSVIAGVMLVAMYIYRMVFARGEVVSFSLTSGALYRFFKSVRG